MPTHSLQTGQCSNLLECVRWSGPRDLAADDCRAVEARHITNEEPEADWRALGAAMTRKHAIAQRTRPDYLVWDGKEEGIE